MLVSSEAETLDPRYAVDAVSHRISRLVHAGLMALDPDTLVPTPLLARSLRFTDATTAVVELRDDVRFHSGKPLVAADVVATLRAYGDAKVGARAARVVDAIERVEATGERTVLVHLRRPHATLATDLELPILRADEAFGPPRPDGTLDGLGPYRVRRFASGTVELVPVSARAPVVVRTVRDENARALRLLAGRADVAVNVLSPTLLPALVERGVTVRKRPGANVTYLLLRTDRAPFDQLALRRAASLAIDRQRLTRSLLADAATPASGALPSALWAAPGGASLPHDTAAAARDIAAAGGLRLSLLTTPDRVRSSIARAIAQDLGDAGALVDVTALELGTLLARLTSGDFDAAILNMPELTEPNVLRLFLHSASIPPAGTNRGRVRDARIDALLDEAAATPERATRAKLYAELEARLRETHLFVPLWHEDQVSVVSARARDFAPSAEGRWLALRDISLTASSP